MKAALVVVLVFALSGCALKGDNQSACSDPLGLYVDSAYQPCCLAHDADYRRGGTEADRRWADQMLYLCVRSMGSESDAASMFYAVRLGGRSRFHYWKD